MDTEHILKNTVDEGTRSWIQHLAEIRIDRLNELLVQQNLNLDEALKMIKETEKVIEDNVIQLNRGGTKGMCGFIAEVAQCGLENARQKSLGQNPSTEWINDNGPADLKRGAVFIQQKFVNSGGHLSLRAVSQHRQKYPEFLKQGGKYQIPKDHYEKVMKYFSMTEDQACKLNSSTDDYSIREWREVQAFFKNSGIQPDDMESSLFGFDEVQKDTIRKSLKKHGRDLKEENQQKQDQIRQDNKAGIGDGLGAAAVGAAMEGLTALVQAILQKRREGKAIAEFDQEDWNEIFRETGIGTIEGGIRGAALFIVSNAAGKTGNTASAVTNGVLTAGFATAEQIYLYRTSQIGEKEMLDNAEAICLESAIGILFTLAGQTLLPIPVVGSLIGNTVGSMIYQFGKDTFDKQEKNIVEKYLDELKAVDQTLSADYQNYVLKIEQGINAYLELILNAFVPDPEKALEGSVILLRSLRSTDSEILDSYEKIEQYFLN